MENAVVIPDAAVIATPRGYKVVYVVQDGKASMRKVTLGLEQGDRVQVTDGIQPGEMVIIAGNLNLKDGAAVQLGQAAQVPASKQDSGSND